VGLKYANDVIGNNIAKARHTLQFIGDTQLVRNKHIVETWKLLRKIDMDGASPW
jgi:hypothetical protein